MSDLKMIKDDPSFTDGKYEESLDAFNHEVFANTIYKIIEDNDPPLTIGLFGGWGVGKTSIINLLRSKLSKKEDGFVYFNAWEYGEDSFRRQFLLNVANSEDILPSKEDREENLKRLQELNHSNIKKKNNEKIKLSKPGLIKLAIFLFIAAIGVFLIINGGYDKSFPQLGTGIFALLVSIIIVVFQRIEQVIKVTVDEAYDPQLIFPEQFADEFDKLIDIAKNKNNKKNIIIVIDDLDRCETQTIKNILVTLKTFLGRRKCYFIIPIDDSSVVRIFEEKNHNFGYEQLRKYFSISVRIPELHFDDLIDFAEKVAKKYNVPADVTFIAALGYCNDARKMKHFLNLYKIKEAIAIERKEKGFLGDLEIDTIRKQLAKLLVLEYQYPEVYRYVSKYHGKVYDLTELAIGSTKETGIVFQEINEHYDSDSKFWDYNPGLKDFLKKTNDIHFEDFDILSKLKIPKQEKDLSIVGLKIRNILSGVELTEFEKIDNSVIKENSFQVYQTISRYFDSTISTIIDRAYKLAIMLIEKNLLIEYYNEKLINEVVRVLCDSNNKLTLTSKDSLIVLNKLNSLNSVRKKQFASKFETDLLDNEKIISGFTPIINNNNFSELIKVNNGITKKIQNKFETDLTKLKNEKEQKLFIDELNAINYTAEERKNIGLIVPSPAMVTNAISFISELKENFNSDLFKSISMLISSDTNPFDFKEINNAFSEKAANIFKNNISDYSFNDFLKNISDLIINSPSYLVEKDSILIANSIQQHYPQFNEDAKLKLLLVFHISIYSIKNDTTSKSQYLSAYNSYVDSLPFESFKSHNEKLKEVYVEDNEDRNQTIKANIERKWIFVDSQYTAPNDEILNFTTYCSNYSSIIDAEKIKLLILKVLALTEDKAILNWKEFIIKVFPYLPDDKQIEIQNKTLETFKEISRNEQIRKIVFNIFSELTELNNANSYKENVQDLINELSKDEDVILRNIIADNIDKIIQLFGEDILKNKVNDIMNSILEKNDLDKYGNSIQVCLKFNSQIRHQVWERTASKLDAEIYDTSLSNAHKDTLLELCKQIDSLSNHQRKNLSETLYYLKDSDQDDRIKTNAWVAYQHLIEKEVIKPYKPPKTEENEN